MRSYSHGWEGVIALFLDAAGPAVPVACWDFMRVDCKQAAFARISSTLCRRPQNTGLTVSGAISVIGGRAAFAANQVPNIDTCATNVFVSVFCLHVAGARNYISSMKPWNNLTQAAEYQLSFPVSKGWSNDAIARPAGAQCVKQSTPFRILNGCLSKLCLFGAKDLWQSLQLPLLTVQLSHHSIWFLTLISTLRRHGCDTEEDECKFLLFLESP